MVVSAPPTSVMGVQSPKVSQVPLVSVASERSTVPLEVSRPEPVSLPLSMVRSTDRLVYQGPLVRSALCPVGAEASAVMVSESLEERPLPLTAVTVVEPSWVAPTVQA